MSDMNTAPDLSDIVTAKELADFFGVTEAAINRWRIPAVVVGVRRFYFKQTVVAYLKSREGR